VVILGLIATPVFWLEFAAYSITMAESIWLFQRLLRKEVMVGTKMDRPFYRAMHFDINNRRSSRGTNRKLGWLRFHNF
jgi:hypothetical protein